MKNALSPGDNTLHQYYNYPQISLGKHIEQSDRRTYSGNDGFFRE